MVHIIKKIFLENQNKKENKLKNIISKKLNLK